MTHPISNSYMSDLLKVQFAISYCVFGSFTLAETMNTLRQISIAELRVLHEQRACKRCGRTCHNESKCFARFSFTGDELPPVENILKFTTMDVRAWIDYERSTYFQREAHAYRQDSRVDMSLEMELRKCYVVTDNILYDHAEKCLTNQMAFRAY